MTAEKAFPNIRQQIHEIFVQLQERFRNLEKRQPITLLDALAFTNMAHDYAMSDLQELAEQLEKRLGEIERQNDEVGHRVTKLRLHTLLMKLRESLKP